MYENNRRCLGKRITCVKEPHFKPRGHPFKNGPQAKSKVKVEEQEWDEIEKALLSKGNS
jgi:hypothetical protein